MEENLAESCENQPRASSFELLGQEQALTESKRACSSNLCPRHEHKRVYPKWMCPVCGTKTCITNKKRHLETKKHRDVVYISTERFEMRR